MTASAPPDGLEIRVPVPTLIEALSNPRAYGLEGEVEVVQTHVSVVFLVGDRAYKIKKPVRLWGYLDYGSIEMRRRWCEEEVRLNRRTAPDTYLGVERVVRRADGRLRMGGEGEVVEHAVAMRRLPEGATYLERLEAGELDEGDVRAVALRLAAFHREHVLAGEEGRAALPDSFGEVLRHNLDATRAGVEDLFPEVVHEGLERRLARHLRETEDLIRSRLAAGRVVDGHGDVRLEHVVRRDDRIDLVDCVEFHPSARHVDGLSDLAFLSIDLVERGRPDLAERLEAVYREAADEDPLEAARILPLFRAYRAHVRAKVDLETSLAPEVPTAIRAAKRLGARRFLALAWTCARADEIPPMIVLRGPSGVGKSVLATALAPLLDARVVRSDLVRKELAGLGPTERVDGERLESLYGPEMGERTYAEVLARGEAHVRAGRAVLLDATYLRRDGRMAAREAARRLGAPFAVVDLTCPDAIVRERIRARQAADTDASDADVRVYEEQRRTTEALGPDEAAWSVTFDSREPPELHVLTILERLEHTLREDRQP